MGKYEKVKTKMKYEDRPKDACPHCGTIFDLTNIRRHVHLCGLLPDGETLTAMMKHDRGLTAYGLSELYGVDIEVTYRKLIATTGWTRETLFKRGETARQYQKNTVAMNTEKKRVMIENGAVFCLFCEVANDKPICFSCEGTLERFSTNGMMPNSWAKVLILAKLAGTLPKKQAKQFKRVIKKGTK